MSPRRRMITNRRRDGENFNSEQGPLTYWVADGGDPTVFSTWRIVGTASFRTLLVQAADELGGSVESGRDPVLGLSAGIQGLREATSRTEWPSPNNVWDIDCTPLFSIDQPDIHSAYFEEPQTLALMRRVLTGIDRKLVFKQSNVARLETTENA